MTEPISRTPKSILLKKSQSGKTGGEEKLRGSLLPEPPHDQIKARAPANKTGTGSPPVQNTEKEIGRIGRQHRTSNQCRADAQPAPCSQHKQKQGDRCPAQICQPKHGHVDSK